MLFVKFDVFNTEGTAANGIRLILVLLVTSSQRQLVYEVQGDGPLSDTHFLRFEVWKKKIFSV